MKLVFFLLLVLLAASEVCAQETFKLPPNPKGIIVEYLEKMKVKDVSRRLTEREKHELCRLLVKAYVISIREHRQDYYLTSGAPLYRLLVTNFPSISAREGEGGAIIFLGAITSFFNTLPEYRNDVIQVMREDIRRQHCK